MQLAFGVVGFIGFFVMVFFFPETSHPGSRGIEKWRTEHGYTSDRTKFVWINPLLVLKLLKSPNLLSVVSVLLSWKTLQYITSIQSLAGLGVLITDYGEPVVSYDWHSKSNYVILVLLMPLAYTFVQLISQAGWPVQLLTFLAGKAVQYHQRGSHRTLFRTFRFRKHQYVPFLVHDDCADISNQSARPLPVAYRITLS